VSQLSAGFCVENYPTRLQARCFGKLGAIHLAEIQVARVLTRVGSTPLGPVIMFTWSGIFELQVLSRIGIGLTGSDPISRYFGLFSH
jgi:hypothetical protein